MIIRIFEPTTKFGDLTLEYHDFTCDIYQIANGVLHLMTLHEEAVLIPLTSIKLFKQLPPVPEFPIKPMTDADFLDELDKV